MNRTCFFTFPSCRLSILPLYHYFLDKSEESASWLGTYKERLRLARNKARLEWRERVQASREHFQPPAAETGNGLLYSSDVIARMAPIKRVAARLEVVPFESGRGLHGPPWNSARLAAKRFHCARPIRTTGVTRAYSDE